jgi:transcriptional regulator of acetoin/glycerol metabolism
MVLKALEETEWNITKTAQLLGVERRTIQRKIKQFNLVKKTKYVSSATKFS